MPSFGWKHELRAGLKKVTVEDLPPKRNMKEIIQNANELRMLH